FRYQTKPFAGHRRISIHESRYVSTRVRKALDETASDRICDQHEYNRYAGCQPAQGSYRWTAVDHNDIWLEVSDFLCKQLRLVHVRGGPAVIQMDISSLAPAEHLKPFLQSFHARYGFGVRIADAHQHADFGYRVRSLGARHHRPRNRSATNQCDELASFHAIPKSRNLRRRFPVPVRCMLRPRAGAARP